MPYVDAESRERFDPYIQKVLDVLPAGVGAVIQAVNRIVQSLLQNKESLQGNEPDWMQAADLLMWMLARDKCGDALSAQANSGDVNYCITRILDATLCTRPIRYSKINRAIGLLSALIVTWAPVTDYEGCDPYVEICGVLDCAKMEMYRKLAVNYEDKKCVENGEVYGPI